MAVLLQYAAWTFASEAEKAEWVKRTAAAEEEERATGVYLEGVAVARGDGGGGAAGSAAGDPPPGGWDAEWVPDVGNEEVREQLAKMEAHLRRTEQLRTDYGRALPRNVVEAERRREEAGEARVAEAAESRWEWAPEDPLAARRGPALTGRGVVPASELVDTWLATEDPMQAYMAELEAHMASCERMLAEQEEQKEFRRKEEMRKKALLEAEERRRLLDQLQAQEDAYRKAEGQALDVEMQVHKVQWLNGEMVDAIGEARRAARKPTEWIPTWKGPVRVPPEDRTGLPPPPPEPPALEAA